MLTNEGRVTNIAWIIALALHVRNRSFHPPSLAPPATTITAGFLKHATPEPRALLSSTSH